MNFPGFLQDVNRLRDDIASLATDLAVAIGKLQAIQAQLKSVAPQHVRELNLDGQLSIFDVPRETESN